jgi:hypothetical protein
MKEQMHSNRQRASLMAVVVLVSSFFTSNLAGQTGSHCPTWQPSLTNPGVLQADRKKNSIRVDVNNAKDIPSQLWARLLRGKSEAYRNGAYHDVDLKSGCWIYMTVRCQPRRTGAITLEIPADLRDKRWLNVLSPDGFDDGFFTVVFETRDLKDTLKLDPACVKDYFNYAIDIKVPAATEEKNNSGVGVQLATLSFQGAQKAQKSRLAASGECVRFDKLKDVAELMPCDVDGAGPLGGQHTQKGLPTARGPHTVSSGDNFTLRRPQR